MRLLILALVVLAGCAETEGYVLGKTPRMVTLCQSPGEGIAKTLARAEKVCASEDLHAELLDETEQRCSFGPMTVQGYVTHFRCVD